MPYISEEARDRLNGGQASAAGPEPKTAGELNYLITSEIINYVMIHGDGYSVYNEILGALEGAKLEFYRRVVVPYEEQKRYQNGDVY